MPEENLYTDESGRGTAGVEYTERLQRLGGAGWKRIIPLQANPYRWNVRRLELGFTLDIGCGIGRNLGYLDGNGVGVDHNPTSISVARQRGLTAYTPDDFLASAHATPGRFDALLAAHLLEHVSEETGRDIVKTYLPFVRSGGKVVFITPQEKLYASDPTHIRWVGFEEGARLCADFDLRVEKQYSYPLPRRLGKIFLYSEFVTVARVP